MAAISRPLRQLEKLYLLVAVAILTALPIDSKMIGYDCSDAPIVGVSPVSEMIPACDFDNAFHYDVDATLLYRNMSAGKILARQCIVRYNESSASDSPLMSAWTFESIDRETCLKAHETEKLTLHGQVVDLDITGTKKRIYTDTKIRDYEVILKTHLATVYRVFNLLKIENTDQSWCDYDAFECDFEGGKLHWEAGDCKSEYQAFFSGHFDVMLVPGGRVFPAGRVFAVAEITDKYYVAFELDELHSVCSSLAYKTKSWNWEIALNKAGILPPVLRTSLDVGLYNKAVHVEDGHKDSALNIVRRLCEKQKEEAIANIQRIRETSVWDEADVGMIAKIEGDHFVVRKCSPVEVRRRRADGCYNIWPIFDQLGREKFMSPRSRIITDNATRVPCIWDQVTLKPKVVPTSEFEDFLSFVTAVGAFSSGLWTVRFALGQAFQLWFVWGAQQDPVQQTNDSRFGKCMRWIKSQINSFFVLIEPPFYS